MNKAFLIGVLQKHRIVNTLDMTCEWVEAFIEDVLIENEANCAAAEDIGRYSPTMMKYCDTCDEETRHKWWRNRSAWICFICGSTWFTKKRRAELDAVELTTKAIWDK